jgi:hypothetical protein
MTLTGINRLRIVRAANRSGVEKGAPEPPSWQQQRHLGRRYRHKGPRSRKERRPSPQSRNGSMEIRKIAAEVIKSSMRMLSSHSSSRSSSKRSLAWITPSAHAARAQRATERSARSKQLGVAIDADSRRSLCRSGLMARPGADDFRDGIEPVGERCRARMQNNRRLDFFQRPMSDRGDMLEAGTAADTTAQQPKARGNRQVAPFPGSSPRPTRARAHSNPNRAASVAVRVSRHRRKTQELD